MRLIQAVSFQFALKWFPLRLNHINRWECTETARAGIFLKTSWRKDEKSSGNVMSQTSCRRTASRGRETIAADIVCGFTVLTSDRCAINPEHCDIAFPTEINKKEQSYSRLRYKLSLLSSEFVYSCLSLPRLVQRLHRP